MANELNLIGRFILINVLHYCNYFFFVCQISIQLYSLLYLIVLICKCMSHFCFAPQTFCQRIFETTNILKKHTWADLPSAFTISAQNTKQLQGQKKLSGLAPFQGPKTSKSSEPEGSSRSSSEHSGSSLGLLAAWGPPWARPGLVGELPILRQVHSCSEELQGASSGGRKTPSGSKT